MVKRLALLMVTVLFWSGLPSFAAEITSGVNLLLNPGFDTLYTDKTTGRTLPVDWGWSFWGNSYTRISQEMPHSGTTCVEIINKNGKVNPSICADIKNIRSGDTYTVGYFARSPKPLGASCGFGIEIDYYDKNGNELPLISGTTLRSMPPTEWTEYKQDFVIPQGVDSLRLWFALPASGSVFLDDVFFCHTKEKTPFSFETDAVFYYTDDLTPITATVSDEGNSGKTVKFSLFRNNAEQVIANGKKGVTLFFKGGEAVLEFPVSTLAASMTEYVLCADVMDKNGNTLETFEKKIYRYPRPARLRQDGVYIKNGEPFMPVIGYHLNLPEAGAENELTKSKEIGINVFTLSYFYANKDRITNALKTARQNDMMAIVCLYRNALPAGHSYNVQNTMEVLSEIKKQKLEDAVFAFALMDEPMLHDRARPEDTMHVGYRIVRETIPEIPVICVDHRDNAKDYKRIADYCDILMSDAYPAGASLPLPLWEYVYTNLSFAKESADKGNRILYSLLQGCEWYGLFPTAEELRHTAMQSFLAGARAIGYYGVNDGGYDENGNTVPLWEYPERWKGLSDFAKETERLYRHFNMRLSDGSKTFGTDGACGEAWTDGEMGYAVITNFSGDKQTGTEIRLPFEDALWTKFGDTSYTWAMGEYAPYTLEKGEAAFLQFKKIGNLKFFVGETETDAPKAGETVRAETVLPAEYADSFLAIYADDGKELADLILLTGNAENGMVNAVATFMFPKGENLSYKHVLWDGLVPKISQRKVFFEKQKN